MTDPLQLHVCKKCGYDAGSKFALKKHRRICEADTTQGGYNAPYTPSDSYILATRQTKYHRFVS